MAVKVNIHEDDKKIVKIPLFWPPSINTYWRRNGSRYFISSKGMEFRKHVMISCIGLKGFFNEDDRISMHIDAFPPDNRRRDLDNLIKALADSLQHAEVYKDDNQIDDLQIVRKPSKENRIEVILKEL